MDTYALEKLTGWTPELSPPTDSPLYRWRMLAGNAGIQLSVDLKTSEALSVDVSSLLLAHADEVIE